jgi:hypothetical protein
VTIRSVLIPALQRRFPDRRSTAGESPDIVAVFPAAYPDVGDLIIEDDEVEATVFIGTLTHGHFNPYDETHSPDESADAVAESVLSFLEDLFSDRIVIWSVDGSSGGWETLTGGPVDIPAEARAFVWSGPWKATHLQGGG